MKKVGIITQARYGSSRLKGKVLLSHGKETYLESHLSRLKQSRLATNFILATTTEPEADEIEKIGRKNGFSVFKGSENDVLDRFYHAAKSNSIDVVVRVTSDCPLNDGRLIDTLIEFFLSREVDYVSNINPPTFPDGLDIEIFSFRALEEAWLKASDQKDREHVTPFIRNRPQTYISQNFENLIDYSMLRLTLDTKEDHALLTYLFERLGTELPWVSYVNYLQANQELLKINQSHFRNSGY